MQEAIAGLPMGVLNKVALRAAGADRLDLPDSCGMDQFVPAIDDPAMTVVAWAHGSDHVICFAGGSHAAEMERGDEAEACVRGQLAGVVRGAGGCGVPAGGGGDALGERPVVRAGPTPMRCRVTWVRGRRWGGHSPADGWCSQGRQRGRTVWRGR